MNQIIRILLNDIILYIYDSIINSRLVINIINN